MDLFTVVAIVAVLTVLFVAFSKWRYQYWTRRGIPQVEPELLFGNFRPIFTGVLSMQEHLTNVYKIGKANGWKQVGLYQMLSPQYMIVDLNIIKHIMVKDFEHFPGRGMYHDKREPLTANSFYLEGAEWKRIRAKLTPTFTTGKMKMMFEALLQKANVLNKVISERAKSGGEIQIKETLARFGTDVIGSVAFGIECNSLEEPDNKFRKIGKKAFEPNLLKFIIEQIVPSPALLGYRVFDKEVSNYFTEVVEETVKYREANNVQRKDFMQLLVQLKKEGEKDGSVFTVQDIITEAFLFYLAGFETSSSATTFAILELSQNQDVQDKLREEVRDALEKHDGKLTYDLIMEMEYLDKVMHEALRKYPSAPLIPRRCTKRYKVPGSDLVIEKGTRVYIPIWGIQKDSEYYPNPEEFNPENFSAENKAKRPDFTWIPFGEGPRQCIGLRFGLMQSKIALITLVRDFRFSPHKNTKWPLKIDTGSFVLAAKGDIWLQVEKL